MRRVTVTVPADRLEDACDVLLPQLPGGIHERREEDMVHLSWYETVLDRTALAPLVLKWREDEVPDDPQERRATRAPASLIGGRILVRPLNHPPAPEGVIDIAIEARTGAFGTGVHPTTRNCLDLMAEHLEPGGSFGDLGCGSGVLSIAAARLGRAPVVSVDVEDRSVHATAENGARNGVELQIAQVDMSENPPPPVEVLAANMPAHLLEIIAGRVPGETRELYLTGFTSDKEPQLLGAYAAADFALADRREENGWVALLLRRDTTP